MKKSTHRGFRGPNNFLLARPMFSSRNRTSFFRRRIDRCRASIDRGARKRSKTVEKIIAFLYVCLIKSTHCGFRGPNNFLLARRTFLYRNRTSFFRPESTDADASIDRCARKRSKTVEKIIAFPKSLPNKIDASRFSGPEQFFAGAPYVFLKKSRSKMIENGRKNHSAS